MTASGLWDDTLVVWMGDFGRTPVINANNGRDHFPTVTPVAEKTRARNAVIYDDEAPIRDLEAFLSRVTGGAAGDDTR